MDHVLVSFHSQASPTLSTFLFSNTKNRRFRQKVTKAPALAKASMPVSWHRLLLCLEVAKAKSLLIDVVETYMKVI